MVLALSKGIKKMPLFLTDNGWPDETPCSGCGWPRYCCLCPWGEDEETESIPEEVVVGQWSKPPIEIAREYFPNASEDELASIMMEYTGYPSYWHDPSNIEGCFRQELQEFRDNPDKVIADQEAAYREMKAQMERGEL